MDTRFWGPSGWKLLHLVAADSLTPERRAAVKEWIRLTEYILPCKYCRASFHDYVQLQPLTDTILQSPAAFSRWMYDIHNRVNGKLRGQGLLTETNPCWPTIRDHYKKLHAGLCSGSPLLGWDFMTSVAFSTPERDYKPVPMPDAPDVLPTGLPTDLPRRNRYNLLTREERLDALAAWWRLIPSILPCEAWRSAWAQSMKRQPPLAQGRQAMMRWMWAVEKSVCAGLKCPTPHQSFPAMKHEVSAFESGCGKQRRGKTCRSRKTRQRDRVRTRRIRRGVAVL